MRNEWYGDKRDIIKWSILIDMAESHDVRTIFQVTMFRPDGSNRDSHLLISDGERNSALNNRVYQHFRDIHDIQRLAKSTGLNIAVHDDVFKDRGAYFDEVIGSISMQRNENWIVFLDPDTGIEPKNANLTHIKKSELKRVYDSLHSGDLLVVYQHMFRDKSWVEIARDRFASAIEERKNSVSSINCFSFVKDVTFLVAKKK